MDAKYGIADKWNKLLSLDESFPDVIKLEILKRIVESEAYKIISGFIEGMNYYDTLPLVNLEEYKHDFIRIIHDMYWSDILITPSITEWPNDKYFCVEYEGFCRNSLGINLNVLETAFHKLAGPGTKENINHSLFSAFEFCPVELNPNHNFKIGLWCLDFKVYVPSREEYNESGHAIKYIDPKTGEDKVSYGSHSIFPKEIAELLRVEPGYSMHQFTFNDEKYSAYFYEEKH